MSQSMYSPAAAAQREVTAMRTVVVLCVLSLAHSKALELTSQYHVQDGLGGYAFGHSGGPNARHEVKGPHGITNGGFSYVDGNGLVQSAVYTADPLHGFRVAATNLPVAPSAAGVPYVSISPSPIAHSGPLDTPEVAAAKLKHAAAHAKALSRFRRATYWPAPLNPDGTVAQTPEVKAAAATHASAHARELQLLASQDALARSLPDYTSHSNYVSFQHAPISPDGTVAETPEVAALKAVHFAAHAGARSFGVTANHVYNPYRYIPAPLNPDGTVAETPEIKAAKAVHFNAYAQALHRSRRSAPLNSDGTVADTPEVKLAKAEHYLALERAKGLGWTYSPWAFKGSYPYIYKMPVGGIAPLNADGTVAETPAVAAARAAHITATIHALNRVGRSVPLNPDGTVAQTPEVSLAAAAHLASHHAVRSNHHFPLSPFYNSHFLSSMLKFRPSAPLNPDGTVAETPEVKAAAAIHAAAHLKELSRLAHQETAAYSATKLPFVAHNSIYPITPLNPDGTVAHTPEVQAATAAHLAAYARTKFGLYH